MIPTPRQSLLFVCILLVSLSPVRADVVKDPAGRFSVDIPSPAQRDTKETDTPVGKIHIITLTHDGGTCVCMVSYNDYPAGSLVGKDPAVYFDGWSTGQAQAMQATIRSIVPYALGGVAGRETIMDLQGHQAVARSRAFAVGDRLYQVMYIGASGTENNPEVLKFLNSFQLGPSLPTAH